MESVLSIRPHHGLCTAYFEGKGYSQAFTDRMWKLLEQLKENPELVLTVGADTCCGCCPNRRGEVCMDEEKIAAYDRMVLSICGLEDGQRIRAHTFLRLVQERILIPEGRKAICGQCRWASICDGKPWQDVTR